MATERRKTARELIEELKQRGFTSDEIFEAILGEKEIAEESLEEKVSRILHEIGMPAHINGYRYVRKAIILVLENPKMIEGVTKVLYPEIAKEFDTTPSRVERGIRHAIEVAWDRGDTKVLQRHFGYTIQAERGKPTNSEFIAMLSDNLILSGEK